MSPRRVLIVETQMKQYRQRFFTELAGRLAQQGVELRILYSAAHGAERTKRDTVELDGDIGIKVPGLWLFGNRVLFQPIWRYVRTADLVITEQGNKLLFNYVLLVLSRLGVKRIAYWGHGYNHQASGSGISEWLKRKLVDRVDWWFAYTDGVARYLVDHGVARDTISVLYNTIDTSELSTAISTLDSASRAATRARLGIPEHARVGLFCGSLYTEKKLAFLIESARYIRARIAGFHLVVVGDGPDRATVERASRELPYVHYVGAAFGPARASYFAIADVFMMPGLVGLAVVDAFAAGLPVLTTDVPLHSPEIEYVADGVNGVMTRHDTAAYGDATIEVLSDANRLERMGHAALEMARSLTLDRMVAAFADGVVRGLGPPDDATRTDARVHTATTPRSRRGLTARDQPDRNGGGQTPVFTTSWDDGHPLDVRVAELLWRYGFRGTFYVPQRNSEGRPVLSDVELRQVAKDFEIGSHTRDHMRLDRLERPVIEEQIADGKRSLEDQIGRPVAGFCYPGGVHSPQIRAAVQRVGFAYARTISNFCVDVPTDRYRIPTTIQLYPHRRFTYAKNFVRGGSWRSRTPLFATAVRGATLVATLRELLTRTVESNGVFHLWGHSWEIEEMGLWSVLAEFLEHAAAVIPPAQRKTNCDAYAS
jgi:glycosyltransferase involved in cell wall biosynthesis